MPEEEQEEQEEPKKETDKPDVEQADKTPTAIEAATALADRIDAGNKKAEELLERQEKLHAEQMLGGHSNAGQAPEPKKELTNEQYKDEIMAGKVPAKAK